MDFRSPGWRPGREGTLAPARLQGFLPRGGRAVRPTVLEYRILEDSKKETGGSKDRILKT